MARGRVRFGVKNVYYALITDDGTGKITYSTPVAIPGAKHLTLEPQGDDTEEYADDTEWYSDTTNSGYKLTLEMEDTAEADTFEQAVLGQSKDEKSGVVTEKTTDEQKEFALMWQFGLAGDGTTGKRGLLYRCKVSRPKLEGQTNEGSKKIATKEFEGKALGRLSDDKVKSSALSSDSAYADWFKKVYDDTVTQG